MEQVQLQKLHLEAFKGETDYIPLVVKVASQQLSDFTNWESMQNPQKAIQLFLENNSLSMQVESDWIPCIESNFFESLIPSLFGAEVYSSPGGLVDVKAYKTSFDNNGTGMMQEKVAVCTDLHPNDIEHIERFFEENPFFSKVKRKGGRGLTATVIADTVDQGKKLYEKWQELFIKSEHH